jgi:SpoVK/Ycf46/Vps4 family AAA+-type ATPase
LAPVLKQSANPKNVVFLSPSFVLPNDLQKEVAIIEFDLPSFADIRKVLDEMIDTNRQSGRIKIDLKNNEAERLAKAALGLTLQEAENAFARAMVEDGRLSIEDVEVVLDEKCQIIKKTEILEYVKTDLRMEDVGGLENLKRWLKKRENSWLDSAQAYGLPAPKGVLITGVPGCGKSLIAKAISAAWQLPLLRLDIGKIFSGLVGSSEENMRKAIKTAEAIAPCILWIDEIEKGFGAVGSSNDSGTSSRVFGSFLTWMQEKTKAVFVVATANNIQALPPEFLRKGRFDEIFFVDLPTRKERSDIFMLHMNRRLKGKAIIGDVQLTGEVMMRLSDQTEGFVGAEIEQVVVSGLFEAFSESRSVKIEDFERSVRNTVPLSVTQAEQIRAIRDWANVRAVAATTLEQRAEYVQPPQKSQAATAADAREDIMASRGGRTVDF